LHIRDNRISARLLSRSDSDMEITGVVDLTSEARSSPPLDSPDHPLSMLVPHTCKALAAIHHYLVSTTKARRRTPGLLIKGCFTVRINTNPLGAGAEASSSNDAYSCHLLAKNKPYVRYYGRSLSTSPLSVLASFCWAF
jgi:hypothetical protein